VIHLLGSAFITTVVAAGLMIPPAAAASEVRVIATVDGEPVTERDLQAMMVIRRVPESLRPKLRSAFIERLIDERLMRAFLKTRKVDVPSDLLEKAVRQIHGQIRRQGGKPEDVLKRHGLDDAALRSAVSLPVAWNLYARKIITDKEIRARFRKRPFEFNGTKIRARQIVLKLPKNADAETKRRVVARLEGIRSDIAAGRISFADAAKQHSTAPSKRKGGDVGFFAFRGEMPLVISRVAFALKDKEISKPFVTPFGVHIIQVTERRPGQLSLEDARPEIFRQLAREHWTEIVARLRKSAKIERAGKK